MDPATRALQNFQGQFRTFREDAAARVLLVETDVGSLGVVQQALKGEEWHPKNRSPFLIFSPPQDQNDEHFIAMAEQMRAHYGELRTGLEKEGTSLQEFGSPGGQARTRWEYVLHHLARWIECTRSVLDPPLFCWLTPVIADRASHTEAILALVNITAQLGVRFVFNEDTERPLLLAPLTEAAVPVRQAQFRHDEEQLRAWFRNMMLASPKKGRAPGTPPGAAAPDVEPPRRAGPQRPSDEQIRKTLGEAGLPPVLTAPEGEQLQRLIFSAADGMATRDAERVLRDQYGAYELCGKAGVKVEQGMMALVLASYLVQFNRDAEACEWFREAAHLARAANALPQVSQALMGMAYVYFKCGAFEPAATIYVTAAEAAAEGSVPLLVIENLRMAGLCMREIRKEEQAIAAWLSAIEAGRDASAGEIASSNLRVVIADLTALLHQRQMGPEQERVHAVEREIAAKLSA
jgi:tetratricopeptide (TPR) repeat protein